MSEIVGGVNIGAIIRVVNKSIKVIVSSNNVCKTKGQIGFWFANLKNCHPVVTWNLTILFRIDE